jgi:uncharacterized repeat protein (TIGR01451 family)
MTAFIKTRSMIAVFALVALIAVPVLAQANLSVNLPSINLNDSLDLSSSVNLLSTSYTGSSNTNDSTNSESTSYSYSHTGGTTSYECSFWVDGSKEVNYGDSITVHWKVSGYGDVYINGSKVASGEGSKTFDNITTNTIYNLTTEKGGCNQTVQVTCLQIVYCELELRKSVDKATAKPGDIVTYTINIKSTGTGKCTGGGVKIVDVLDPNIEYLDSIVTSNLTKGYGTKPVYDVGTRTLYFNGNTLDPNESGTITWTGKVKNPTQCGDFEVKNQAKATAKELNNFLTWVYSETVKTDINNDCYSPVPQCDSFSANPTSIVTNNSTTLTWETSNATRVAINNGIGNVSADGSKSVTPLVTTTYVLSVFDQSEQLKDTCEVTVTVSDNPVPICKSFTATPNSLPFGGGTTKLAWEVERATSVSISPIVGSVALVGNKDVQVTTNTNFVLTAVDADGDEVTCPANVIVLPKQDVFTCVDNVSFTASDYDLVKGESSTLNWTVAGADSVTVNPGGHTTSPKTVTPDSTTTYTLTATKAGFDTINCPLTIRVEPPQSVFSCENNVNISVSDNSIRKGESITLNWNVTNADSVSINPGGYTSMTGNQTLSPTSDTTYTLTATKGGTTINCPVAVNVTTGGGGGGSSSPKCELTISDKKIKRGQEVTLKWDTSRATEVTLTDDRGKVIFTTDDMTSAEKKKNYDGSIKVKPTRDTKYTLIAERGTRDRECEVKVELDDITVLQTRDQQPLVAGIALSNVPYTGFEAGPVLTLMFYTLLMAWALYVAYFLVIRQRRIVNGNEVLSDEPSFSPHFTQRSETVRPDVFPTTLSASTATAVAPPNLPVALPKTVGYESYFAGNTVSEKTADAVVTELENRAHNQKALLSSDAIEYFMRTTTGNVKRNEVLDEVISEAKKHYPLEDGWIVINQARMHSLCDSCVVKPAFSPVVTNSLPNGSGSLAEAIVTGNVAAAYQMIGNRPMFALADAAADFDSVMRARQGKAEITSDLLKSETAKLSDTQLKNIVAALTGALDGTYTDEASAVKMAIMKAVKEIA